MESKLKNEAFLRNFGGVEANDLTNILNSETETDDSTTTIIKISNYHDLDDILNKPIFTKKNQFKILSFNSESIFSKLDEIKIFLETLKLKNIFFDAICINECWLEFFGEDLNLLGYSAFPLPRKVGTKGGLVTYINENFKVKELDLYEDSLAWEGQFFDISGNGLKSKLLLSNLYVPPRTSNDFTTFETNFLPIINVLTEKYKNMIITGDINADALQFNSNKQFRDYFDNLTENGLLPVITLPTHFGPKNGSIIDHIYVKSDIDLSDLYSGISLHKFSDHLPIFCSIPLKNEPIELPKFIKVTNFSDQNWHNLSEELSNINWSEKIITDNLFANPNINYNIFIDTIIKAKDKHLPTKTVRFKRYKHKNNAWITTGLLTCIKQKDHLYKKLHSLKKDHPNYIAIKNEFKSYEKNLKNLIYTTKKKYHTDQFNKYRSDIKNTWQTNKVILNKNKSNRKNQTKFCVNGNIVEGDLKIANEFNKFFSEIGPTLAAQIKPLNPNQRIKSFLQSNIQQNFFFSLTTPPEVLKIINTLENKTSSGFDLINAIFVKKLKDLLIYPLATIINQSLSTGIFPDKLKIAKIIPLFKKNEDNDMNNYRPISLLPLFSKIFEKIVQKQLYNYLNDKNLLYDSQHGFRENYSTESAVIELTDYIKLHVDNQHIPICLFLDLSKAFDTINFDILLLKLKHMGLSNMALNWFESYLKNRKQFVTFNGCNSDFLETKTGVPQGSVLGPLLFLIYINDLCNVSNLFKVICFADDSTLIISICYSSTTCKLCSNSNIFNNNMINLELNKIYNWFCINKLSINPEKTKFMIFKNKQRDLSNITLPILKLNEKTIERVHKFLYLGIYMDEDLTWEPHIDYIANKISKNNGVLKRIKNTVPRQTLKLIYFALIHPHLNYGTLLWGYNLDRIENLQKKSIRTITHSYTLAHTENLFKELQILKIKDIFNLKQIVFYYKFLKN